MLFRPTGGRVGKGRGFGKGLWEVLGFKDLGSRDVRYRELGLGVEGFHPMIVLIIFCIFESVRVIKVQVLK